MQSNLIDSSSFVMLKQPYFVRLDIIMTLLDHSDNNLCLAHGIGAAIIIYFLSETD